MSRKTIFALFLTAALCTLTSASVIAQNSPVRGEVKLKKPDGTVVPVVDALVEAFRTDIGSGKMPEAKTNKRGEFSFVGFPLGQRYVLTVSGPGIGPRIQPDVKGGMERIMFVVNEGDGRRLTETEAREAASAAANLPPGGAAEVSAETKKQQAELQKKNAKILESNKKA
ncbi:MAG: carboxypeptidase regulatory-like domain-containing protein, partial [Blastocatellia bacterium]|nr:carboxypeptidase regulatory-like domain-containing protein [Blastocatellia bacterium]